MFDLANQKSTATAITIAVEVTTKQLINAQPSRQWITAIREFRQNQNTVVARTTNQ